MESVMLFIIVLYIVTVSIPFLCLWLLTLSIDRALRAYGRWQAARVLARLEEVEEDDSIHVDGHGVGFRVDTAYDFEDEEFPEEYPYGQGGEA